MEIRKIFKLGVKSVRVHLKKSEVEKEYGNVYITGNTGNCHHDNVLERKMIK